METEKNFTELEVGKTYKSREGEIVRIKDTIDYTDFPYRGYNGERYQSNGRWSYHEGKLDLIELIEELSELTEQQAIDFLKSKGYEIIKRY